jgi:hypothetical protein
VTDKGRWPIDGPAHDSVLHRHVHDDREPSAEPHSHPHLAVPIDARHDHPHRHVYDIPALEAADRERP